MFSIVFNIEIKLLFDIYDTKDAQKNAARFDQAAFVYLFPQ